MKKHINFLSLGSTFIFAFLIILISCTISGMDRIYKSSDIKQAEEVKKIIQKAAVQCYALEGAYPPSLEYLQKNYGIMLNKNRFFYTYDIFGSNVAPQIDVLPINR